MNVVAAIGLALGGMFGLIGTVVTEQNLRAASWGIDGVGLVATSLLAFLGLVGLLKVAKHGKGETIYLVRFTTCLHGRSAQGRASCLKKPYC